MKLFIDDADINEIKRLYNLYPVDGVTTSPSILSKQNRNPKEVLKEIREFIGKDTTLFAQVLPEGAEGMIEDALSITKVLGNNTVIKIPSIPEGFRAIRLLKEKGITTCGTVVYTPMQAYLAAKAGASYVAPYVNRIDNMGYDGVKVAKDIHDILIKNNLDCMVLAASFRNSQQVLELCKYGIGSCTCAPAIMDSLVKSAAVDDAIDVFIKEFNKLGSGKSMKDYFG